GIMQLDALVHLHDKLAEKAGQDVLYISEREFKSMGTLILDFRSPSEAKVKVNDKYIAIPTTQETFNEFSENELINILRYIRSIEIDGRYHNVADRIVKELAERLKFV